MAENCTLIDLPDGRRLAYAVWGAPTGTPVFYCHGFPGSRLEARLGDAAAAALGIRLIAPDRPGFGRSSPLPGRRLSGWPADLAALADQLEIARFHLVGVSGGAPYAIACGQALTGRIERIALVCGLGEMAGHAQTRGMNAAAAAGVRFYQRSPALAHGVYSRVLGTLFRRRPGLILRLLSGFGTPADREVLADPWVRSSITRSFAEAFAAGGEGPADELGLFTRPWDIDPAGVRVPVQLWHGDIDTTVPPAMGHRLARLLPDCEARFVNGEGHFSLIVRYLHGILAALTGRPPEAELTPGSSVSGKGG